jgi:two-component system, OmpR family, response regulator
MKTILIVDDDILILNLVHIHLTDQGYHVLQAKDGMEALEVLKKEACDLAIVDVMMPFMDGYTLTKQIRKEFDIPVILLTEKTKSRIKSKDIKLERMII